MKNIVNGAEGIIIIDNKILLGMQKRKRWYSYNNESAALIKTIGGSVEKEDKKNSLNAFMREMNEELIMNIKSIDTKKIFHEKILMGDLNIFDKDNKLSMNADFYLVNIDAYNIKVNDLPCALLIPIKDFINLSNNKIFKYEEIEKYVISSNNEEYPKYVSFFVPNSVYVFLKEVCNENWN